MKVKYHRFTGSMPVIFVERFEDFANNVGTPLDELDQSSVMGTTDNFCKFVSFKGSPLKFVVFAEGMMRTMFGKNSEPIIDATLAIYEGNKKYPMNEKLAMNHAVKLAIKHERREAYRVLSTEYENRFEVSCPYEYEDKAMDESFMREAPNTSPNKRPDPKKKPKRPPVSKTAAGGQDPTKGYTHVRGGEGNLYVKGDMDQKRAQAIATKKGADAKLVNGKLQPLSQAEKQASAKGQDTPQQQPAKAKAPQQAEPRTVKMVKTSPGTVNRTPAGESSARAELNTTYEQLGGKKKKDVDPKVGKAVAKSKTFREDIDIPDQEFEAANEGLWVSDAERMTLDHSAFEAAVPRSSLKLLERLINTKLTSDTSKIGHFTRDAGAGQIASQAGELTMMMLTALDDDQAEEVFTDLMEFISETGNQSILTKDWLVAAAENRKITRKRLDMKYGKGKWKMHASGWDTKKEFEAMTGLNYEESKGYSTDVYFTVATSEGIKLEEVSLKKDLGIFFLNSGPKFFTQADPSLEGTEMDVTVFNKGEQDLLVESMNRAMKTKLDTIMKKNPKHKQVQEIQALLKKAKVGSIDEALAKMQDRNARKAVYRGIELLSEAGEGRAKKTIARASERYQEYYNQAIQVISKNKKVNEAMLSDIRQRLPLRAAAENEEAIALGPYSIDRATLKHMFGTNDPDAIMDKLSVFDTPPPAFLGYAAGPKAKPIPVAKIRIRPEAIGYGGRVKFDMEMHSEFKKTITRANKAVYGD